MRHVAPLLLVIVCLLRLTNQAFFCLVSSSSSTTTVLVATYICVFSSSSMHSVAGAEGRQQQQRQKQEQQKQQQPLSAGKLRSLGEVALSERRYADAESHYLQATRAEPDNAVNHHRLYTVRKRRGGTFLGDALGDISRGTDLLRQELGVSLIGRRIEKSRHISAMAIPSFAITSRPILVECLDQIIVNINIIVDQGPEYSCFRVYNVWILNSS